MPGNSFLEYDSFGHPIPAKGGSAFVVFGDAKGFGPIEQLGDLDGKNGFRIDGLPQSNLGFSVSAAGDFNHDGIDDLLVSAIHESVDTNKLNAGGVYVGNESLIDNGKSQ